MWIDEVDIRGFKRLRGRYSFARGLTLVTGPNEAGKSSLHQALVRTLFGFSRSERRVSGTDSVLSLCAPWDGGEFGIRARLTTGDGRSLSVLWDFSQHSVQLLDADTGADMSHQVRGKRDEVLLGRVLLSVGLDEFRQVCSLDQATLAAVKRSEPLVLALRQAVETGAGEGGVERAVALLGKSLGKDGPIGVRVDTLNPLPGGRLARLEQRQEALMGQLAMADETRERTAGLAQQLAGHDRTRADVQERLATGEQHLLMTRGEALRVRLERARDSKARADLGTTLNETEVPEALESAVRSRLDALQRAERRLGDPEPRVDAAKGTVEALEARRITATQAATALDAYADTDESAEAIVRQIIGRRAAFIERASEPPPIERDPLLARYREERDRLTELQRSADDGRHGGIFWALAAGVAALAALVVGIGLHPAGFAGLGLVAVLGFVAWRRGAHADDAGRALGEALVPYGPTTLAELDARAGEDDRALAGVAAVAKERERRRTDAERERQELDARIAETLARVGVSTPADLDARAQAYLLACVHKSERVGAVAEEQALKNQIAAAREPLLEVTRCQLEIDETHHELMGLYARAGIEERQFDAAARRFEEHAERSRQRRGKNLDAQAGARALEAALNGLTFEQLVARDDDLRQQLREHIAVNGVLADRAGDEISLERELSRLRKELAELNREGTALETQISEREETMPEVPALREEAEALSGSIASAKQAAKAIKIAREALDDAASEAHREFAPHLRAALEQNLGRLTGGRYREAAVDEDLEIALVAPETGAHVSADQLSRGTQDQIYVLERLQIARMLDKSTDRPPLLLDDPFVHFDEERLVFALELLAEEATQRQVILFSNNEGLEQRLNDVCGGCQTIRLPPPKGDEQVQVAKAAWGETLRGP